MMTLKSGTINNKRLFPRQQNKTRPPVACYLLLFGGSCDAPKMAFFGEPVALSFKYLEMNSWNEKANSASLFEC